MLGRQDIGARAGRPFGPGGRGGNVAVLRGLRGIEADYSLVDEDAEPEWGEEPIGPVGYVETPNVTGMSYQEAKKAAEEAELTIEALGSGEVVSEQFPAAGEEIRKGTKLILYLEGENTNDDRTADEGN